MERFSTWVLVSALAIAVSTIVGVKVAADDRKTDCIVPLIYKRSVVFANRCNPRDSFTVAIDGLRVMWFATVTLEDVPLP